jgi:hypothetical protein
MKTCLPCIQRKREEVRQRLLNQTIEDAKSNAQENSFTGFIAICPRVIGLNFEAKQKEQVQEGEEITQLIYFDKGVAV